MDFRLTILEGIVFKLHLCCLFASIAMRLICIYNVK